MIERILKEINNFYVNNKESPSYILLSKDLYLKLETDLEPFKKYNLYYHNTGVSIFHGLTVIVVKGIERLEIA